MGVIRFIFCTVLLVSSFSVKAQPARLSSLPDTVRGIEFYGLTRTSPEYLQWVIDSEAGQEFDSVLVMEDLQRLINLPSLLTATYSYRNDTLRFTVDEAWTVFPIINFGGVEGNVWFQLGFNDINFLGKGMQLVLDYRNNDRRNNFNFYYKAPNIRGTRWGSSLSLVRFASVEPLYFTDENAQNITVLYRYTNYSVAASAIYQIDFLHTLEFGGSWFRESYEIDSDSLRGIGPGPDELQTPKILGKVLHSINRLDYHYFYVQGFDWMGTAQAVYDFEEDNWFYIGLAELKYFHRFGRRGNFASRLRLGFAKNDPSPFAPFVLDSHVNIRGSGNRIDRGTGQFVLNLEYRQTLFDEPRFAGQLVGFSDLGTWRSPGGALGELTSSETLRHFVGGGLRLIYKKAFDASLRIDYGVDLYDSRERGVVIGFGQYF